MMEPAGTTWPAKTLTPSRLALESRPFLEEPRPFLCAIAYASCSSAGFAAGFLRGLAGAFLGAASAAGAFLAAAAFLAAGAFVSAAGAFSAAAGGASRRLRRLLRGRGLLRGGRLLGGLRAAFLGAVPTAISSIVMRERRLR